MSIKHKFHSPISDDGLPQGAVKPSNWNDDHDIDGVLGALATLDVAADVVPYLDSSMQGKLAKLTATGRALLACVLVTDVLSYIGAAPIVSPALGGTPTAPTAPIGTYSDQIATMAAVQNAINALIGGAPGALNTLNGLAAAINNNASYAATITNALAQRLQLDAPQGNSAAQMSQGRANLGLGTSAVLDVGTIAGKIVQLDGNAKLPAVDGSQLTNVIAAWSAITGKPNFAAVATSGAYSDLSGRPTLGTASALDVGTAANKIVQLDGSAKLPAVDGSQLTNVNISGSPASWRRTVLTAGSGVYATKPRCAAIRVRMVGGGGGGGQGLGPTSGANGGSTTFGTLTAGGGVGGRQTGGVGGGALGGDVNITGGGGQGGSIVTSSAGAGGVGGSSAFGGAGVGSYAGDGGNAAANSGSGGGGGGVAAGTANEGGGGGAGGYLEKLIVSPSGNYNYTVGAGGGGAPQNLPAYAGGQGGDGIIIIDEFYF